MNDLVAAIQMQSQVRLYDWCILGLTLISIIVSSFAIFFAIRVPTKIALEQNKIAMFDKRYSVLKDVMDVLGIKNTMNMVLSIYKKQQNQNIGEALALYTFVSLEKFYRAPIKGPFTCSDDADVEQNKDTIRASMFTFIMEKQALSKELELLFSKEIASAFSEILSDEGAVYCFPTDAELQAKRIEEFVEKCNDFEKIYVPLMESYIIIDTKKSEPT